MMQIVEVNYVAVLAAAIASFVIGALWYSPMLFGKMWMKLSNVSGKEVKKAKRKLKSPIHVNAEPTSTTTLSSLRESASPFVFQGGGNMFSLGTSTSSGDRRIRKIR